MLASQPLVRSLPPAGGVPATLVPSPSRLVGSVLARRLHRPRRSTHPQREAPLGPGRTPRSRASPGTGCPRPPSVLPGRLCSSDHHSTRLGAGLQSGGASGPAGGGGLGPSPAPTPAPHRRGTAGGPLVRPALGPRRQELRGGRRREGFLASGRRRLDHRRHRCRLCAGAPRRRSRPGRVPRCDASGANPFSGCSCDEPVDNVKDVGQSRYQKLDGRPPHSTNSPFSSTSNPWHGICTS